MKAADVYLVTGDDDLDDPAWGITPIYRGTVDEVATWLRAQPRNGEHSVVTDTGDCLWAYAFLALMDRSPADRAPGGSPAS